MKKKIILANLAVFCILVIIYMISPNTLNPLYASGAFSILFAISAFLVVNVVVTFKGVKVIHVNQSMKLDFNYKAKGFKVIIVLLVAFWGVYFLANFLTTPLFNSKAYKNQIGTLEPTTFSEDMQLSDLSQVPIVDKTLAYSLADKKLGENPGMGSQVVLGEPVIQQVEGELVWAVPLLHSGFFKWLENIDGSAGYIKVSATNLQDIEFVQKPIKYQPNSFFFDDIDRYLRVTKGMVFDGFTDYSFEINDQGEPYWIITTYKNTWMYGLPEATGVITLNAQNGDTKKYSKDEVPDWIDRVQPENFILDQLDNQGRYIHGIFNFSNQDKFMTSSESAIIYNEGNCYLFTGLTSVGADESAMGFVMVDMVTKESKLYQLSGATETAAMRSAEGAVQQFGYRATSPIIINHNTIPTYFVTLKDNGGLIKQYAFVSVSDVTTVGIGDTISIALRDYNNNLSASNSFIIEGNDETITGEILRIASEYSEFGVVYKFILSEKSDKIFSVISDVSPELALTTTGDKVEITYFDTNSDVVTVNKFDNLEFSQN